MPILNKDGFPLKQTLIRRIVDWLRINWKTWIPILISLIALVGSIYSVYISNISITLNNRLAKLNFRPILQLDTTFQSIGKLPPHFSVTNVGPVEAQQIKILRISHRYSSDANKIFASGSASTNDVFIEKLNPQESKSYKFHLDWINTNARLHEPVQHNVMEIKITYRRPQDLEEYDESAYYFVNPDGLWVSEASSSLNSTLYESIKSAIFNVNKDENMIYKEFEQDKLHSNK
jgi:hypothetical protein